MNTLWTVVDKGTFPAANPLELAAMLQFMVFCCRMKCPHCATSTYRLELIEPSGSPFKLNAVACSGCGATVGVLDYHNTGEQLKSVEKRLDRIEALLRQRP